MTPSKLGHWGVEVQGAVSGGDRERNWVRLPIGQAPCRSCNFHLTPTCPPAG